LVLGNKGSDFAVMDMHFKLGLYEHQSAGAIQAVINLLGKETQAIIGDKSPDNIEKIKITSYEPAFGIIGDPEKRNPKTRQSADHSMVYIISNVIRKALSRYEKIIENTDDDELWKLLMLSPLDYSYQALNNPITRKIMEKIEFAHGGEEYD
jgi:2-methylcitrate dehydratase